MEYALRDGRIVLASDNPSRPKIKLEDITREQLFDTMGYGRNSLALAMHLMSQREFNLDTNSEPLQGLVGYNDMSFVMQAIGYDSKKAYEAALWILNHGGNITDFSWRYLISNDRSTPKTSKEYKDLVIKYLEMGADPFVDNNALLKNVEDDDLMERLLRFHQIKNYEGIDEYIFFSLKNKFINQAKEQAIPLLEAGYPYMTVCQIMDEAYYNGFSKYVCNNIYKMAVEIGKRGKNKYYLEGI